MLVSASHDSPQLLCKTKPVLPPPEEFLEDEGECPPLSPLFFPSINPPPPPRSSPPLIPTSPPAPRSPTPPPSSSSSSSQSELHTSLFVRRARALTFHSCKAGEDEGRFNADYLGMKDVDMYAKSINSVAKELAMNQRPKEVQVFVTSERVRLAPPNSPTLFRSFMVKDILLVRKCSKNKRIIGVMVWKRKVGVPSCHILRCQDDLVATALYNAVWQQTQKVDEVAFSKVWVLIKVDSNEWVGVHKPMSGVMVTLEVDDLWYFQGLILSPLPSPPPPILFGDHHVASKNDKRKSKCFGVNASKSIPSPPPPSKTNKYSLGAPDASKWSQLHLLICGAK